MGRRVVQDRNADQLWTCLPAYILEKQLQKNKPPVITRRNIFQNGYMQADIMRNKTPFKQ
jgi:hypothetical protein